MNVSEKVLIVLIYLTASFSVYAIENTIGAETVKVVETIISIVVIISAITIAVWSVKSARVLDGDLGYGLKIIAIGILLMSIEHIIQSLHTFGLLKFFNYRVVHDIIRISSFLTSAYGFFKVYKSVRKAIGIK